MSVQVPLKCHAQALDVLCPLHVQVDGAGHILHAGPTLQKLRPEHDLVGERLLEVFEVQRPRHLKTMKDILVSGQSKLHLKFRNAPHTQMQGILVPDPGEDGAMINLSFGISILEAVQDYDLTSADFAGTDLAVELLFLVEAKSAVLDESRKLNERLQVAKTTAERQAFTDALTGIKNRRAVEHRLGQLLQDKRAFSFMQMDLDFFKAVNDTFGHAAGDAVLQQVAQILLEETREQDDVARIGGDEFAVIMTGTIPKHRLAGIAGRMIERMRLPIDFEGNACRISASIGIASVDARENLTADCLMQKADKALYASKANGRSQFAFADGRAV